MTTASVQQAVRALRSEVPELLIVTDVCNCEYTSHGHCGLIKDGDVDGVVDNDATLQWLAKSALSHARAGADIVAPSDMMDGRVAAIRTALDANGFEMTPIMAYAAKFASVFYGPFREAADSAPQFRRPSRLPECGPRQCAGGHARNRARSRKSGRKRHDHGEASHAVSRLDHARRASSSARRSPRTR